MKINSILIKLFSTIVFLLAFLFYAKSAIITSAGTGTLITPNVWSVGTSWIGGVVPGLGDDVVIAFNDYVATGAVTISAGKTLTINGTLTITADMTMTGTWSISSTGTFEINKPSGNNNVPLNGTFATTSIVKISSAIGGSTTANGFSQNFGVVIWNPSTQTNTVQLGITGTSTTWQKFLMYNSKFTGSAGYVRFTSTANTQVTIVDSFIVGDGTQTAGFQVTGSGISPGNIVNIGTLVVNNGSSWAPNSSSAIQTINISNNFILNGTAIITKGSGAVTMNLSSDFAMNNTSSILSGGSGAFIFNFIKSGVANFTKSTTSTILLNNNIISFNINNGCILNMGTNICNSNSIASSFILNSGGGVKLGHSAGISTSGSTGNVQVTGTRTFSKGASYEYNGTAAQFTGNGIPDSVKGFIVNNAAGVTLSNPSLTDTFLLGLTSGNIKTDATHTLTLTTTASISSSINIYGDINEGNQNSYVNGPLSVESNNTNIKNLPIGKDTTIGNFFAPLKITPVSNFNKIYTANYYPVPYNDVTTDITLDHVSTLEYWQIECNALPSNAYSFIGLSWRPTSELCVPSCTILDSTNAWGDLVLAHYFNDGSTIKWRMDGGTPPFIMRTGSNINYGYISTTVSTSLFSPFTLGSLSIFNVLPLKFISFNANEINNKILLEWVTKDEQHIKNYELQKSKDGIYFNTIKTIDAKNLIASNFYTSVDENINIESIYYRLKINDHTLKNYYSDIIKVIRNNSRISFFPNPASNYITINEKINTDANIYFMVNTNGTKLIPKIIKKNENSTTFNIANFPNGFYILKIITKGKAINIPFMKF